MKARLFDERGEVTFNPEDVSFTSIVMDKNLDTIIKAGEDEHWRDVRERAAIAAMQGVMNFFGSIDYNRETIAKLAVEQADALIEQLKEK